MEIDSLEKYCCQAPTTHSDSKHLPGKRLVTKPYRATVRGAPVIRAAPDSAVTHSVNLSLSHHLNNAHIKPIQEVYTSDPDAVFLKGPFFGKSGVFFVTACCSSVEILCGGLNQAGVNPLREFDDRRGETMVE